MTHSAIPSRRNAMAAAVLAASVALPTQAQLVLEEVVVTAQKREETLQDVSATVNVVTAENVEKFQSFTFSDIEQQTAGLSLDTPNARNSNISMRGVSMDPESGASSTVDVYLNDQSVRFDIAFSQLYDLERLEILRGPQGTLQGRTSPAGAINIITKKPDLYEAQGYVSGTLSDNDGGNLQAAWGGPVSEGKFGMRIAGVFDLNNSNNVENLTTGVDDPENEAVSARISALWAPSDNLEIDFMYQYFDRDTDGDQALSGADTLGERPTISDTDRVALGKQPSGAEFEYDFLNLRINWAINDNLELVSITGYNDSVKDSVTENDRANYVTNPDALTWQNATTEAESFSQELRLSSSGNDVWDWMVGGYYADLDTATGFTANTVLTPPNPEIGFSTFGALPVESDEYGLFTFNTFYVAETVQLEVGLRYAKYEAFRRADVFFGELGVLPPALEPIRDTVEAGIAASFPIEGISEKNESSDEDAITGSLKVRWDVADSTSLYASYNRGYRRSGISIIPSPNIQFLPNGEDDLLHDEEESDAFEIGFKSRPLNGRASLNGAIYYQEYDGYLGFKRGLQVLDDDGQPQDLTGGIIFNGDAVVWGVEFDGQVLLTETWNLGGAIAYQKGEYDGATGPCNDREPGEVIGECDLDGEPISGEPEWSVSLNTEFYLPFGNNEWYIRGLYKYTDERLNQDASAGIGPVRSEFESTNILSLYTGFRSQDYTWDASLWAKNVTDEDAVNLQSGSDQYDLAASGGSYTYVGNVPERVIGVTARYNF